MLNQPLQIDLEFYNWALSTYSPQWTNFLKFITYFGDPVFLGILLLLLLVVIHRKKIVFFLMGDYALAIIINQILKKIIARPRPEIMRLIPETGYSFPSFHAMGSMAVYSYLTYLMWTTKKLPHWTKITGTVILLVLLILVGFSRIYLGVHYLSDILGGWAGGLLCTIFSIAIYQNKKLDQWLNSIPPYRWLLVHLPTWPKR